MFYRKAPDIYRQSADHVSVEAEIAAVIHLLTQSPPSGQLATLHKYFTPTAGIIHPLCRTGNWDYGQGWNSRWAMSRIYRSYKILSPVIELDVTSVAFDKANNILYAGVKQRFRIWALAPLGYKADVELVTKLKLVHDEIEGKFYIQEQEDLYQTTEWIKFAWFGLWRLVWVAHLLAMVVCILMAALGAPVSYLEERFEVGRKQEEAVDEGEEEYGFIEREKQRRKDGHYTSNSY